VVTASGPSRESQEIDRLTHLCRERRREKEEKRSRPKNDRFGVGGKGCRESWENRGGILNVARALRGAGAQGNGSHVRWRANTIRKAERRVGYHVPQYGQQLGRGYNIETHGGWALLLIYKVDIIFLEKRHNGRRSTIPGSEKQQKRGRKRAERVSDRFLFLGGHLPSQKNGKKVARPASPEGALSPHLGRGEKCNLGKIRGGGQKLRDELLGGGKSYT